MDAALALRVLKVEGVDAQMIGDRCVVVLGHASSDPVVDAHSFEPPDVLDIGEGDPVHLVGDVLGSSSPRRSTPSRALQM